MREFFHLGLRLAMRTAALLLPVTFLLFWVSQPWSEALLLASYTAVAGGIIVYNLTRLLLERRFQRIQNELRDIAERQFRSTDDTYERRDELDDVVLDTRDTARTVENELQRLNKLENYRKEFIGDISHELKTPIFAVQGYIETLIDGAMDDPNVNRRFLEKAMKNVTRLTELTHDLLEISRIETGDIRSTLKPLNLNDVLTDVVDRLQLKAQQDRIHIRRVEFDPSIQVLADRNQLKQVLVNLVENGIKYNQPEGSVTIGVKTFPKNPAKVLVYVRYGHRTAVSEPGDGALLPHGEIEGAGTGRFGIGAGHRQTHHRSAPRAAADRERSRQGIDLQFHASERRSRFGLRAKSPTLVSHLNKRVP